MGARRSPVTAMTRIGGGAHDASLRDHGARWRAGADEAVLDTRVCDCCQTSAAMTAEGPVVVYRDRSEGELRDISIARLRNGEWSEPRTVFRDGWEISGCPVNGPVDRRRSGRRLAVAWFTAANDMSRVKLAFSDDAGGELCRTCRGR